MTGRKTKRLHDTSPTRPTGMWDFENYFDATFTAKERSALRLKLMDICGYGVADCPRDGIPNYMGFEYDIETPAEDAIGPAFNAQGLDYHRDNGRFHDCALIHICRQLQIEYKNFAANIPKLPIDGFIQSAKRSFPDFKQPRNAIAAKIQEHKLHMLWCDWREQECMRTHCPCESHWLCADRFVKVDLSVVARTVARHNETRPKLYLV